MASQVVLSRAALKQYLTFDTLKTVFFVYVLLVQSVKAERHLRARGIVQTVLDAYKALAQVRRLVLSCRCHPTTSSAAGAYVIPAHTGYAEEGRDGNGKNPARH